MLLLLCFLLARTLTCSRFADMYRNCNLDSTLNCNPSRSIKMLFDAKLRYLRDEQRNTHTHNSNAINREKEKRALR